jgi:hypothetical protein
MAGFRKAKAEQAALKVGLYGLSGSGKTFTSLLLAEGLAKLTKKRIAYVDTERGTDFYCKEIPERKLHPQAFDFDALYTKSITEVIDAVKGLSPAEYSVIVIDSITHIWEAARLAYSGKETSIGTIPFHAWAKIKKPYKELINLLLSSPLHVFFCGRQGNEFETDEESGELKKVGVKMKAEGETPYEPHILMRMEAVKDQKGNYAITAFAEKDRTGILAGKTISWPNYDNIVKPLLSALGDKQAKIQDDDETGQQDAEALMEQEKKRIDESVKIMSRFMAHLDLCDTKEMIDALAKELTTEIKKQLTTNDATALREKWIATQDRVKKGK